MTISSDFNPPRRVLCVGAAVLDTLFRVRTLPAGQGKILPYEMLQVAEGMASSAAYAIVRLGGAASLWGAVGNDAAGERIIADLGKSGIETSDMLRVDGARSAISTILIDDQGGALDRALLRRAAARYGQAGQRAGDFCLRCPCWSTSAGRSWRCGR